MREIKFRVYIESPDGEKGMHYPKLISFGCGKLSWATLEDETLLKDNGWHTKREVMQYTGLKDKNGVEIYESDVIHIGLDDEDCTVEYHDDRYVGKWNKSGFRTDLWQLIKDNEIIGNVYENSELLNA